MDAKKWVSMAVDKEGFEIKNVDPLIGEYLLARFI